MLHSVRSVCWLTLSVVVPLIATFPDSAAAQDFKVVTTVSQRGVEGGRWSEVGQSVTLFHAGKVYDYMQLIGEIVVLEPMESRFVILSVNGNDLATTLNFAELQQFLKVARSEMDAGLVRLAAEGDTSAKRRQALQFQLDPQFQTTWDAAGKSLSLASPLLSYEVETEKVNRPQVARQYLQYADWAARMNYVLHSRSLYPAVRLEVNRALLERELIPTEVRLLLDGDVPLQIKAEHKFDWELGSLDRSTIVRCEKARELNTTRWVNFREYQRMLAAQTAQR